MLVSVATSQPYLNWKAIFVAYGTEIGSLPSRMLITVRIRSRYLTQGSITKIRTMNRNVERSIAGSVIAGHARVDPVEHEGYDFAATGFVENLVLHTGPQLEHLVRA